MTKLTRKQPRGNNGYRAIASALLTATSLAGGTVIFAPAVHAQNVRSYDIPAGPLATALNRFGATASVEIVYDAALTNGVVSPGLKGSYATVEALSRLLAGSGLTFRQTSPNAFTLERAPQSASGAIQLGPVRVEGEGGSSVGSAVPPQAVLGNLPPAHAGGQVARGGQLGMLGNRDVMDAPISQTSYTNKLIRDRQARTMQDVLANDSSVIVTGAATTFSFESEAIRGFRVNASLAGRSLNGLPGLAPLSAPSIDFIERVEVLKGPSALVTTSAASSGNIGGTINLVTKQATDDPVTLFAARYVSRSQLGGHIDLGRRFGANDEFGIRVNGTFDKGNTPIRSQDAEAGLIAVNFDYRGEHVRLSADFAHRYINGGAGSSYLSLRNVASVPKAPDARRSLFPSWAISEPKTTIGMVRGEVDVMRDVTAYASIGAQHFKNRSRDVGITRLLNSTGLYNFTPQTDYKTTDVLAMQAGIRAKAATGPVGHEFNFSLSRGTYDRNSNPLTEGATVVLGSIYAPVFGVRPTKLAYGPLHKVSDITTTSAGVADTLSFINGRIQFTAGIRYQKVDSTSWTVATGAFVSNYKSDAWSPAFGLVVKPAENISLYGNYMEGLEAGTTVGGIYANSGEVFAPYVSKQYEGGIKADWGAVTTTLAAFQIARPSTIAIPSTTGGLPTLAVDGEQRNRGIELGTYGDLAKGVRLLGGVTYIDARQTKTAGGRFDGERAMGVPKLRTVIGGEWDIPFVTGLTLTSRLSHTTNQVVSNDAPAKKAPGWTQVDFGGRYAIASSWSAQPITIRFDVDNVFGNDYWAVAADGFVYAGEPRTYRLSATFGF